MKYVTHETWEDGNLTVWALTVAVRRWWAPWTWRKIDLLATTLFAHHAPDKSRWIYRETGNPVETYSSFDSTAEHATNVLNVALIEQRRINHLLEDEPPKLRALTGGRR